MSTPTPATAYSYLRFSDVSQKQGDSIRRQTALRDDWLGRHPEATLDTTLKADLGRSAYKRVNPDRYALTAFLKKIESGRVLRGSYLLIENLDRLTREEEVPACHLLTGILMAGVKVVQLSPYEMELTEKSNGWELMRAVMELSRGHAESKIKSERNGATWENKRECARQGKDQPPRKKDQRITRSLTSQLPAWVKDAGGVLALDAKRAATVRHIFTLAASGLGAGLIVKALGVAKCPPMGASGQWSRAYVSQILKDRRALGEFQPRHANGRPAGKPIAGYYPPVVTEADWFAAWNGAAGRKQPRGRVGEHVNIFAALLWNARDHDRYYLATRTNGGKHRRVLIPRKAMENETACVSFPFDTFERCILERLRELDPKEVLGEAPGQDEVIVLAGELAHVRARQAAVAAEVLHCDMDKISTMGKASKVLDAREQELNEQLAEAGRRAAQPDGEAWGEAMTLATVLDAAPDPREVRLRLRALLRGLVSAIWVLAVGRGRDRLAVVQIYFDRGGHRDYLILSRPPKAGRGAWRVEGGCWAASTADVPGLDALDLRDRACVAELQSFLLAADLGQLQAALAAAGRRRKR